MRHVSDFKQLVDIYGQYINVFVKKKIITEGLKLIDIERQSNEVPVALVGK